MIPTIHIHYSEYLDGIFEAFVKSIPIYKEWVRPSVQAVKESSDRFRKIWEKEGKELLKGICLITGLDFVRNYFPVYVVCGATRPFSNPIVMKSRFTDDEFKEQLIHELIHCLFVDNKESAFVRNMSRLYQNDHVALYAVMESVMPGILEKGIDTANFPENQKYQEAISHVKTLGHQTVISSCKSGHLWPRTLKDGLTTPPHKILTNTIIL